MGLKDNLTLSNGDKINIQVEETERLKRLQAKLQRQVKCSNNYYKTKSLIAKEYQHMSNKKNDITNKIVHRLLTNYSTIVIQDDNLNKWKDGAASNHTNRGKEIQHSVLGRIKMRLKESGQVIWLDRWFPTTQYCFECNTSPNTIQQKEHLFVLIVVTHRIEMYTHHRIWYSSINSIPVWQELPT